MCNRLRALGRTIVACDNYLAGLGDGRDLVSEQDRAEFILLHMFVAERAIPFLNYWAMSSTRSTEAPN